MPPSDVEAFVAARRARLGVLAPLVETVCFRGSRHVQHLREHPVEYADQLKVFCAKLAK